MKKLFSILVITCLLAAALSMSSFAAEPNLLWDFGEGSDIEDFMDSANSLEWAAEGDYHVFTTAGGDPYVSMRTPVDDVSQIVWAKARVKNPGPAQAIELFGATNGRGLAGPECTHIDIQQDNEWHTYIIYIPTENVRTVNAYKDPVHAITEPYWEGSVEFIRLDAMWQEGDDGADSGGSMNDGDQIMIDYIAFFATEEDAKAFREEAPAVVEEVAAPVAEAVEAPAAEAAAPAPVTAPAVTAPQTSDATVIAAVVMLMAAAAIVVLKKTKA
jgi:3-oxoacyl-[acyl-carrier protein] reductase